MEPVKLGALGVLALLGFGATLHGLALMEWPNAMAAIWIGMHRHGVYLLAGVLAMVLIAKLRDISPLAIGAASAALLALLSGAAWALVVALWFALASAVVGRGVLSRLASADNSPPWSLALSVGAGIYGTVVGLLAHYPVNQPGLYGLFLALPLLVGWRTARSLLQIGLAGLVSPAGSRFQSLAIILVALFHFGASLMPEVGHDALAMHLFIPSHLMLRQQWDFNVGNYVWAVMPALGDWIFACGYMLAGETAARLINVGFIFLLAWLVRDIVLWAGGTADSARWAVLIFLSTPLTFTASSSLFVESIWGSFVVGGIWAVLRALAPDGDSRSQLPLAGLLLGFALAAKAVTFTILPALLPLVLWRFRSLLKDGMARALTVTLGLLIVAGAIPYATAWQLSGNPVFPYYNQVFQSPFYPPVNFDSSVTFGKGVTWDVLYQMVFHSSRFMECRPGAAGFQWLLLFVPAGLGLLLGRRRRGLALLAVAVLAVVTTFQAVSYLRYIFPSFVLVAACIGIAWADPLFQGRVVRVLGLAALCLTVGLNLLFFKSGTYYGDFALRPLLSERGRDAYLQSHLPIRGAVELVNQLNVNRAPVAFFSPPLAAGLSADALYPNWYNHRFQGLIGGAGTERDIVDILCAEGVEYVILDANWGTPRQRALIEQATEAISERGTISVRSVRKAIAPQALLLRNSWPIDISHSGNPHEV